MAPNSPSDAPQPGHDAPTAYGRRPWLALLAVFAVALAVRFAFLAAWPAPADDSPEGWFADEAEYHAIATNLLAGMEFEDAYGRRASRPPGYPLFLAGAYRVSGGGPAAVRLAQALLGAFACLLAAVLAGKWFPRPAALLCGLFAAFYPFLIYFTNLLLSETLFVFLLLAGVLLLAEPWKATTDEDGRPNGQAWMGVCAGGLVLGLGVLVRSSLLLFPPCLACLWLVVARRRLHAAAMSCALLGCVALVQAPWVARNHRVFERPVLTTLQVGQSLYEGAGPGADGGPRMDRIDWSEAAGGRDLDEYEINEFFKREAINHVKSHPLLAARLAFVKLGRLWNPLPNAPEYRSPLFLTASLLSYLPVMVLALVGAAFAWREWRSWCLLVAPALYYSGLHMVFVGSVRYRTPVMPFLMVLSAWGAVCLWRRLVEGETLAD